MNHDKTEVKAMLNHIVTMGRLVRDPELRHTQSGIPVTCRRAGWRRV